MTDTAAPGEPARPAERPPQAGLPVPIDWDSPRIAARVKKRYREERRFRRYGLVAVGAAFAALVLLAVSIVGSGYTAFFQTHVRLEVFFDPAIVDPHGANDPAELSATSFRRVVNAALLEKFPEVKDRRARRALIGLVSSGAAFDLYRAVRDDIALIGQRRDIWLIASDDVDMLMKGRIDRTQPEANRRIDDRTLTWIDLLDGEDRIEKKFNIRFFTAGASREPELAGIAGALLGSLYTLLVTLMLCFPVGVTAAVYLEEFAPTNKVTDFIEININNLAAVPSIVFGLLGLEVYLNLFHLPRSAPVVGGLTLALMTLPTIIIAARAALKSVPPSIRQAALGLGASKVQSVTHHVLPLAMPGILTGTIIGMAQALGESAPLLMIGMVAFIADLPGGLLDAATVMPVQIYQWADSAERAFVEKTSAAIIVLLFFLMAMNALAVFLRKKFERNW